MSTFEESLKKRNSQLNTTTKISTNNSFEESLKKRNAQVQSSYSKPYNDPIEDAYNSYGVLSPNMLKQMHQDSVSKTQAKKAQTETRLNEINQVTSNPDYIDLSKYTAQDNKTQSGLRYNLINQDPEAKRIQTELEFGSNPDQMVKPLATSNTYLNYLNDNEKGVYNYLYNKNGEESANEYVDLLKGTLEERMNTQITDEAKAFAEEYPVMSTLETVATAPLKGASLIGQSIDYLKGINEDGVGVVNENAWYNQLLNRNSTIRGTVGEKASQKVYDAAIELGHDERTANIYKETTNFLYQTGLSMADNIVNTMITGGGLATFTGVPGGLAGWSEKAGEVACLMIMSSGAAADSIVEAKKEGLPDDIAFTTGFIAGAVEYITEKMGYDALFKTDIYQQALDGKVDMKQFLKFMARNAAAEASEEGTSDVLNLAVEAISDQVTGESLNSIQRAIDDYISQGMNLEDASKQAWKDWVNQLIQDILGGALSGGAMAGGGVFNSNVIGNINATNEAMTNPDVRSAMLNEGLSFNEDTLANKLAIKNQAKIDSGKNINFVETFAQQQANKSQIKTEEKNARDLINSLKSQTLKGEGITNSQAEQILSNESALNQLGIDTTDAKFTKLKDNEKRQLVKTFFEPLASPSNTSSIRSNTNTQSDNFIPQIGENVMSDEYVQSVIKDGLKTVEAEGQKVFKSISENTQNKTEAYGAFKAYYGAGRVGTPVEKVNTKYANALTLEQKIAANNAGQRDALTAFKEQNNETPKFKGGKITMTPQSESLRIEDPKLYNMLSKLASATSSNWVITVDKEVEIDGIRQLSNGDYDRVNGSIRISKDNPHAMITVAKHEVTHRLQNLSPKEYQRYKNYVLSHMESGALEDYIARTGETNRSRAEDEVVAYYSDKLFRIDNEFEKLVNNDYTLGEKLHRALVSFIADVKEAFGGKTDEIEDLIRAERLWANALRKAEKNSSVIEDSVAGNNDKRFSVKDSEGNTLSKEQAEYFKDSKIRDEDGNLLPVYHGTDASFTVFDATKSRANMDIQGNFFTPWKLDAQGYGSNVGVYYINITNPASEAVGYQALNKFKGQNEAGKKAREYLIKLGYDGVNNGNEEFIAFYPEQIKEATNIKPTANPDVRYSTKESDLVGHQKPFTEISSEDKTFYANYKPLKLGKAEYAKVRKAVFRRNSLHLNSKTDAIIGVYTDAFFYLCETFGDDSFTVLKKYDIETKQDVIRSINYELNNNSTDNSSKSLQSWNRIGRDYSDNVRNNRIKNGREVPDMDSAESNNGSEFINKGSFGNQIEFTGYHGTSFDFNTFNGDVTFYTDSKDMAKGYGDNLKKTTMTLNNPLVIYGEGNNWDELPFRTKEVKDLMDAIDKSQEYNEDLNNKWEELSKKYWEDGKMSIDGVQDTNRIVEWAKNHGYDGVVFKDITDYRELEGEAIAHDVYAVFNKRNSVKEGFPDITRNEEVTKQLTKKGKKYNALADKRDAGEKFTYEEFINFYRAHKLLLAKTEEEALNTIKSIQENGFESGRNSSFNINVASANNDNSNLFRLKYRPFEGNYVILVPDFWTAKPRYDEEYIINGFKPLPYEIIKVEYNSQPYYELYDKAYNEYYGIDAKPFIVNKYKDYSYEQLQELLKEYKSTSIEYETGEHPNIKKANEYTDKANEVAEHMRRYFDRNGVRYSVKDSKYLELAQDPKKNETELRKMVEEAAKNAFPNSVLIRDGKFRQVWHHTNQEFNSFLPSLSKMPDGLKGIFFASSADGNITSTLGKYHNPYYINVENFKLSMGNADGELYADKLIKLQKGVENGTELAKINEQFRKETGIDAFLDPFNSWWNVLDPTLIKSANPVTYDDNGNIIPLSERFNSQNDDIRYSVKDSLGNTLSKGQQEYFKDSVARDKDGNLLIVYHGSLDQFTTFDKSKIRAVDYDAPFNGFWFSSNRNTGPAMSNAKHKLEGYLNITNPAPSEVWRRIDKEILSEWKNSDKALREGSRSVNDELRARLQDMGYDGVHFDGIPKINWDELYSKGETEYTELNGVKRILKVDTTDFVKEKYPNAFNMYDRYGEEITGYTGRQDFEELYDEVWVAFEPDQFKSIDNLNPTENPDIQYSIKETDKDTLKFLNKQVKEGKVIKTYKSMQVVDGKLYPPMAGKVKGEDGKYHWNNPSELNTWMRAVEDPSNIAEYKNGIGYYNLNKGNGKSVKAAYNPYEHSSNLVLNDQFEEAYQRDNLVVVECLVPESEMKGEYKAQYAKDPTGLMDWKSGVVAGKLKNNKRKVYLSRWLMPVRILDNSEVAQKYKEIVGDVSVPFNVVSPSLLKALENEGVNIDYKGSPLYQSIQRRKQYSLKDSKYLELARDPQKNETELRKMVEDAAREAGFTSRGYHGTQDFGFTVIDTSYSDDGISFFITDDENTAETYSGRFGKRGISEKQSLDNASNQEIAQFLSEYGENVEMVECGYRPGYHEYRGKAFDVITNQLTSILNRDYQEIENYSKDMLEDLDDYAATSSRYLGDDDVKLVKQHIDEILEKGVVNSFMSNELLKELQGNLNAFFEIKEGTDEAYFVSSGTIYSRNKAIRELANNGFTSLAGNYDLYFNSGNSLNINAKNSNWNNILVNGQRMNTRDIAAYAKQNNYDSVIIKNVKDNGGRGSNNNVLGNIYIMFNPQSQVKSADVITYDDNGEIIPLSERFNSKNDDIRYSVKEKIYLEKKRINRYLNEYAIDDEPNKSQKWIGWVSLKDFVPATTYYGTSDAENIIKETKPLDIDKLRNERQPMFFDVRVDENGVPYKISSHEGRHRATALLNAGIEKAPVILRDLSNKNWVENRKSFDELKVDGQSGSNYSVVISNVIPLDYAHKEELLKTFSSEDDIRYSIKGKNEEMQKLFEQNERLKRQIKDNRSKYEENIKKEREKSNQRYRDKVERLGNKELRDKITRHSNELKKKLLTPSDKNHINENLKKTVAVLLESINQESTFDWATEEGFKGGKRTEKGKGFLTKRTEAFQNLKKDLDEIIKDDNNRYVIDPDLKDFIDEVVNMKDIPIASMNHDQLMTVWNTVKAVEAAVYSENKTFRMNKAENLSNLAEAWISDNFNKKEKRQWNTDNLIGKGGSWADRTVGMGMTTPQVAFHYLGNTGDYIFKKLRQAQDDYISIVDRISQDTADMIGDTDIFKLEKDVHTFDVSGGKITLSTAQIMSLYELWKREQAQAHLLKGGIKPGTLSAKGVYSPSKSNPVLVNIDDIVKITSSLTEGQMKLADRLQKYMAEELSEIGNDASEEVYGYRKFTEKHYFPISVDKNQVNRDVSKEAGAATIAGKGMTKQVIKNASNGVILSSIFDVYAQHVNDMSYYGAWLATSEDLRRILNYRTVGTPKMSSIRGMIEYVLGNSGVGYFNKLQDDINQASTKISSYGFDKFLGNYKAAAVASNIRVIVQQPTAILRAMSEIDSKYLMNGIVQKGDWDEVRRYSPLAVWKDWGNFDIGTGMQMKDIILGTASNIEKLKQKAMEGAGNADAYAWSRLWNAVKLEIEDTTNLQKGSEEYYKRVKERFEEIIDKTQVVDGVLQRSGIMRSANALDKMSSSFMSEPTKVYNMFMSAVYDYKTNKNEKTKAKLGKVTVALVTSFMVNSIVQSIVDAMRNDDRDKDYWDKFLNALLGIDKDETNIAKILDSVWNSNFGSNFNAAGYIPYVKDIYSIVRGYDVTRMDMDSIESAVKASKYFVKALNGEGKMTIGNASANLIAETSRFLGLPIANIKRDIYSVVNTITSYNCLAEYYTMKTMYNIKSDATLTMYYDMVYKAYVYDKEAYSKIRRDMIKNGISGERIDSAIKNRKKKENSK